MTLSKLTALAAALLLLSGCLLGCGIEGANMAKPITRISVKRDVSGGYFELSNSKDVTIKAKKIEVRPEDKSFNAENFSVEDNASNVREANATQLQAMAMQQTAIYNGIAKVGDSVTRLADMAIGRMREEPRTSTNWDSLVPWLGIAGVVVAAAWAITRIFPKKAG